MIGPIQRFTRVSSGEISNYILLVDSPQLVDRISGEFEDVHRVEGRAGIVSITGKYKGAEITVTTFGVGGPSLAIVVEELSRVGGRFFLKVGAATAITSRLNIGDYIVVSSAIRCDKVSEEYAPLEVPACGDFFLIKSLTDSLNSLDEKYHVGTVVSTNVFYVENIEKAKEWARYNSIALDMDTATLYVLAHVKKLKAAALLVVDSNLVKGIERPREEVETELALKVEERMLRAVKLGLEALRLAYERVKASKKP